MTLLIACHDAGGAEMVSAYVRQRNYGGNVVAILGGPAAEIVPRKLGAVRTVKRVSNEDLVLCGTSGSSDLERRVWLAAKARDIRCAAYLDHWKNYTQRFRASNGRLAYPDEVWVTDSTAEKVAKRELPGAKLLRKGNPYFAEMLADIPKLKYPHDGIEHVLFVHEPGREKQFQRWLRYGFRNGQLLRERPHPEMETPERTLAEDIAWSDYVVGCDSMALGVAVLAGRRVRSLIPESKSSLPFPDIERPPKHGR